MASSVVTLLGERIARQGLGASRATSVPAAVAVTTAVQAQDPQASRLGVRVRSAGLTDADVTAAIADGRSVVRTWLNRGTVHLVTTTDLRWLVRLIGPSILARYRTRWRQLGLTDGVLATSLRLLPDVLAGGPLDRHEISAALAEGGLRLDPAGGATATHLLVHASAVGLVCRGPDRGRTATFALVDRWVPDAPEGPSGDEALAELARRYFRAYSPATAADFVTWSGLAGQRAIRLIREEMAEVDVDGRPGFRLGEVAPARGVHLLPAFDNYVLGYRDRSALVPPAHHGAIYQGGMIHPALAVDGRVAGRWRWDRATGTVQVSPFGPLRRADARGVEAEVADVSRFLERPLTPALPRPG